METTDGSAGYGYKEGGEQALLQTEAFLAPVAESVPNLRQGGLLEDKQNAQGYDHEQHGQGKERIDAGDEFVNGHHGGGYVIDKDDEHPHHLLSPDTTEDDGRTIDEEGSHKHHHQHGEYHQRLTGTRTQIAACEFGKSLSVVSQREHTAHIVVDGTGKHAAQHNPQICCRTEPSSHDGAEDGACASNVQELYHEDAPARQHDVVYAVGLADGWGGTVIGTKHSFHDTTIYHIAHDEGCQTYQK